MRFVGPNPSSREFAGRGRSVEGSSFTESPVTCDVSARLHSEPFDGSGLQEPRCVQAAAAKGLRFKDPFPTPRHVTLHIPLGLRTG